MKDIKTGRLFWTIFVVLYGITFSKNFFSDAVGDNASIYIIFAVVFIIWMGIEFYFGFPFFQSGILREENSFLKGLFGFFFYPFLGFCIADRIGFSWSQIKFISPFFRFLGFLIFLSGAVLRLYTLQYIVKSRSYKTLLKHPPYKLCRHPRYLATFLQVMGISLVFSSYLGIILGMGIGLPIILKEAQWEEKVLLKIYKGEYRIYKEKIPMLFPFLAKK